VRLLAAAAVACIALCASAALASQGATPHPGGQAVGVVRCPTVFGAGGPPKHVPSTIGVTVPPQGLVAYTNTADFVLGPSGLHCHGLVAADGGSQIVVWAGSRSMPRRHSGDLGVTLSIDPACAFCKADDVCPFLPKLARHLGHACTSGVPGGEEVSRPRADLALFEDPAHVSGSGWPSGGQYLADGVAGVSSSSGQLVFRSTCTLPTAQHPLCAAILDDVIARYG